jgi:hypothetical protein
LSLHTAAWTMGEFNGEGIDIPWNSYLKRRYYTQRTQTTRKLWNTYFRTRFRGESCLLERQVKLEDYFIASTSVRNQNDAMVLTSEAERNPAARNKSTHQLILDVILCLGCHNVGRVHKEILMSVTRSQYSQYLVPGQNFVHCRNIKFAAVTCAGLDIIGRRY